MKASVFNLLNAVDNQNRDFGRGNWSEVSQGDLDTKYANLYVGNNQIMENNENLLSVNTQLSKVWVALPLCSWQECQQQWDYREGDSGHDTLGGSPTCNPGSGGTACQTLFFFHKAHRTQT